jgi:hypothetical protein
MFSRLFLRAPAVPVLLALLVAAILPVAGASGRRPAKVRTKKISLKFDSRRRRSGLVTVAAGGTVSTTARDGTKYTLSVPAHALLADTTVSVTPVVSLRGLARGAKLRGAVQLAPEGLGLIRPATLTIATRRRAKGVRGTAWRGSGRYASRYPTALRRGTVRLRVVHFSGYADFQGPVGDLPKLADATRAYYQDHVLKDMTKAESNDSVAAAAIQEWMGWERQAEVVGSGFMDRERDTLAQKVPKITHNQIEQAYGRCKDKHDVGSELRNLMRLENQAALLAGGSVLGHRLTGAARQLAEQLPALISDRLRKCGSFEVDFETELTENVNNSWDEGDRHETFSQSQTIHVRALSVPVQAFGTTGSPPAPSAAPLEVLSFSHHFHREEISPTASTVCDQSSNRATPSSPFEALRLDLTPDDRPSVTLRIDPGSAEADRSGQCVLTINGDPSGPQTIPANNHLPGLVANDFFYLQPPDPTTGSGFGENNLVVKFDGWDYLGGSVWARKVLTRSVSPPSEIFTGHSGGSTNITETTSIELKHRPE